MPYITKENRELLDPIIGEFQDLVLTGGDLNYIISKLCQMYLINNEIKYKTFESIIGMLESAKLEFYRRLMASYEDKKKEENGDVFIAE